jgi:1-acyl-sn-glycerol-3-phosphate acyltransferase
MSIDPRAAPGVLRSGARAGAMLAWSFGVTNAAVLYLKTLPQERVTATRERWVQFWAGGLLRVFGVRSTLVGGPPPPPRGARLVVSNHRSPLDILLMLHYCGGCVLSRGDLAGWPVLGQAAREGGTIFVDRADPRSGVRAIREIRRRLSDGRTVIVFPEGTTFRGDQVRPLQGGAFSAAAGLPVELLPVGVAYEPGAEFVDEAFGEYVGRMARRAHTRVSLCFGQPVPARRDRGAQARELRDLVQELVVRARAAG